MPNEGGALHLVPKHLRKEFEEILNVRIEGDLCPICRYRLKTNIMGNMRDFPLRRWIFHQVKERYRCGTSRGSNNQDTSVLIGSVDISKIDLYPEDDPEFFR